ncbi:MAG TPA: hypothetical protein VHL58_19670 [Thermoanaerobaculia bacterium]|nr:hypothetical protein [Thermoanaerobaculia bacterium]
MNKHSMLPKVRAHPWYVSGLLVRGEAVFRWGARCLVFFMVAGWSWTVVEDYQEDRSHPETASTPGGARSAIPAVPAVAATRAVTSAVLDRRTPTTAFIDDAMLSFVLQQKGQSGKLKAIIRTPGDEIARGNDKGLTAELSQGGKTTSSPNFTVPDEPGIYKLAVALGQTRREIEGLNVVSLVPFAEKKGGRIGLYYLGSWPFERGGQPKTAAYSNPEGFIEITPQNAGTPVSEHFKFRDFLTKDQPNVWPKYLLLQPKLVDKLELVIEELQREGHPVRNMHIMSGFRTPNYNVSGGNTGGRASLSRHMYGDASDVFVDNDGNGAMDDLNHDGRVDVRDAEVILGAAEMVERRYPALVGGVGVYAACCGHGPFTHIDTRGYRARWRGFGNG